MYYHNGEKVMGFFFYTGYGDESLFNKTFYFSSPCETQHRCILLPIEDDNVPEYEEYYTLSLVRPPGLPEWIEVNNDTEIIHIIDDDGMFAKTFYY